MAQIYVNYNRLDEDGNKIISLCEQYDDIISNLNKNVNRISEIWVSDNSIKCQNIIKAFNEKLASDKEMLKEFGSLIIKTKETFMKNDDDFVKAYSDEFGEIIDSVKEFRI